MSRPQQFGVARQQVGDVEFLRARVPFLATGSRRAHAHLQPKIDPICSFAVSDLTCQKGSFFSIGMHRMLVALLAALFATNALAVLRPHVGSSGTAAPGALARAPMQPRLVMTLPSTIMFMRHFEKPCREPGSNIAYEAVDLFGVTTSTALTIKGWMRAGALAYRFGSPPTAESPWGGENALPTPSHIYSCDTTPGHSQRPAEAVLPLVCRLNKDPDPRCMRGFITDPAIIVDVAVPYNNTHHIKHKNHTAEVGPESSVYPYSVDTRRVPLYLQHECNDSTKLVAASVLRQTGAVLVAWVHHNLAAFIRELHRQLQALGGVGIRDSERVLPTGWPHARFDMIWVLTREGGDGEYTFRQVPLDLLHSDMDIPFCSPSQIRRNETGDCDPMLSSYYSKKNGADSDPEWCWEPPPMGNETRSPVF